MQRPRRVGRPKSHIKRKWKEEVVDEASTEIKWQDDFDIKSIPRISEVLNIKKLNSLKIYDFRQILSLNKDFVSPTNFWINVLKNLPCNFFKIKGFKTLQDAGDTASYRNTSTHMFTMSSDFVMQNCGSLDEQTIKKGWRSLIDFLNDHFEDSHGKSPDASIHKRTSNEALTGSLRGLVFYATKEFNSLGEIDEATCQSFVLTRFITPLDTFVSTVTGLNGIPTRLSLLLSINNLESEFSLFPDIPILSYEGFGNIFVGEVKTPSLQKVVSFLNEKNPVKMGDGDPKSVWFKEEAILRQLSYYMVIGECPLGLLTDGFWYIFVQIIGRRKEGLNFKFYITKCDETYNKNPKQFSPRATFVSLMMSYVTMGEEEYKRFKYQIFGDMPTSFKTAYIDSMFELESSKYFLNGDDVKPTYIPEQDFTPVHFDPSFNSTVLKIKKQHFSLEEEEDLKYDAVIVKVFDVLIHYPDLCKVTLEDARADIRRLFHTEIRAYETIHSFNEENEFAQINTVWIFGYGVYSFKRDPKGHGVSNYIACGPSIVMEELTVKPKTNRDFKKGLVQLLLLHQAGINHRDIEYRNMFMRDNDFVFIDFGFSDSWRSIGDWETEMADFEQYERVWSAATKAPSETEMVKYKENVMKALMQPDSSDKEANLKALLEEDT